MDVGGQNAGKLYLLLQLSQKYFLEDQHHLEKIVLHEINNIRRIAEKEQTCHTATTSATMRETA
jgi:hypothetical protein